MSKYLITLAPMSKQEVESTCGAVIKASVGTGLKLEHAYIDAIDNRPICIWSAPDKAGIEALFAKANVKTQSVREVIEYHGA